MRWTEEEIKELLKRKLPVKDFEKVMAERGTIVIQPGMITTCDIRTMQQDRFYVRLDDDDNVVDGHFG